MATRDTNLIESELDEPRNLGSGPKVFQRISTDLDKIYQQLKLQSDDMTLVEGGSDPYEAGNDPQHFILRIIRNAGTLEHFMFHPMSSARAVVLASAVSGPSLTPIATPTGTDASTAMANGIKISDASPETIYFDTADIQPAEAISDSAITARVLQANQSTLRDARATYSTRDINGDTRRRLAVVLSNSDGTAFDIPAALNVNGEFVDVEVFGWMPPFA